MKKKSGMQAIEEDALSLKSAHKKMPSSSKSVAMPKSEIKKPPMKRKSKNPGY